MAKRSKNIISLFKPEMNNSSNAQISYDKTKEKRTDLYRSGGKLDSNGGFWLEVKLVTREPRQQVGLTHARVSDQHNLTLENYWMFEIYNYILIMRLSD